MADEGECQICFHPRSGPPARACSVPSAHAVSDRDAFRAEQQTRRQFGKAKQHEKRLERAAVRKAAEVLAERWTQPLDLMNRREDWSYPERPMSERIKSEVDASYRTGPPGDSSLVLAAPTCLAIAELLADAGLLRSTSDPTYTAAEVKVLTEAALRLGRKEAFEEVFAEIDEDTPDCACEDCEVDRREFARRIRSLASLPQEAVSDAISVPSEGPGTSEPSKAAKTPQDAPGPGVGHRCCDCERGHPIDICAECGDDWPCEEAR